MFLFLSSYTRFMELGHKIPNLSFLDYQRRWTCSLSSLHCPVYVHDHHVWEPAHHPGHCRRLSLPHDHVLIPCPHGHLFHLYYCPKNTTEHSDTKQKYCLCRLHHPGTFFRVFGEVENLLLTVMPVLCLYVTSGLHSHQ